jgi:hypothetical protein
VDFLSSKFLPENLTFPVRAVFQPEIPLISGLGILVEDEFTATAPINCTAEFQDSCIKLAPIKTIFYEDGSTLTKLGPAPVSAYSGPMMLSQWNTKAPFLGYERHVKDSVVAVSFVKACFKSVSATHLLEWAAICKEAQVCKVPMQPAATKLGPAKLVSEEVTSEENFPDKATPKPRMFDDVSATSADSVKEQQRHSMKRIHVPVTKGHFALAPRTYTSYGHKITPGMVLCVILVPVIVLLPLLGLAKYLHNVIAAT